MAKTPKKPVEKSAKAKPARVKPVKKAVGVDKLDEGEQQTYKAKAKEIDLALSRCISHFTDLQPSEARVTIKLLRDYYFEYGIKGRGKGLAIG